MQLNRCYCHFKLTQWFLQSNSVTTATNQEDQHSFIAVSHKLVLWVSCRALIDLTHQRLTYACRPETRIWQRKWRQGFLLRGSSLLEMWKTSGGQREPDHILFVFFCLSFRLSLELSSSFVVHNSSQLPNGKKYLHLRLHLACVTTFSGLCCFTRLLIDVAGCCRMHTGVSFMLGLKVLLSASWFQLGTWKESHLLYFLSESC